MRGRGSIASRIRKTMVVPVVCGIALMLAVGSDANAETVRVSMKDRVFTPQLVKVKVGDRVEWINDDTELHQVISGESPYDRNLGNPMNSGLVVWNASYEFTFTKPGAYHYMCVIHRSLEDKPGSRGMVGEIIVTGE